jgi:hypothetical protein
MPTTLRDVRFRGQSGKHMLALSFSGFDPERTCDHRRLDRQVCLRAALRLSRGWDHCHAAIADATLGENTIGEVLHVSACPPESGHLHAAIVVEMDV